MKPILADVLSCGSDGIIAEESGSKCCVESDALFGNRRAVSENQPGGFDASVPNLFIDIRKEDGLVLKDPDLGYTYWVSREALEKFGCQEIQENSEKVDHDH